VKVKESLRRTAAKLAANGIDDASLEAELLLMHVMGVERAGLYVRFEDDLSPKHAAVLAKLVDRRLKREPAAYILGHREFYGLDFYVNSSVLIPRPETETLVEEAITFARSNFPSCNPVVADIGTGSGAIAVSLARSLPKSGVYGVDISPRALDIAALNCIRHNVRVELLAGDLLAPLSEPVDMIVANLPYIADGDIAGLSDEIREYEPAVALAGGEDGLDIVRRLIVDAPQRLKPGGALLVEVAPAQVNALKAWAGELGPWSCVAPVADAGGFARALKLVLTKH
jgi:release factor glutamine methyltransferase